MMQMFTYRILTYIHDAEFPVAWCDMPAVPARYAEGL